MDLTLIGSVVRHRQPGPLRRGGAQASGRRQPADRRGAEPDRRPARPVGVPAGGDHAGIDLEAGPRGQRGAELRGAGLLDAHLLARQDVDRRPPGARPAALAPAHAVPPRPALGHDRHGLHERPPVGARRPGVRPYLRPAGRAAEGGGGPLDGAGGPPRDGGVDAGGGRMAGNAEPQGRPLRRQHAPGGRHRGGQGRGPNPLRRRSQRLRRRRSGRRGSRKSATPRWTAFAPSTTSGTRWPTRCTPAAPAARPSAPPPGRNWGCGPFSTTAAARP